MERVYRKAGNSVGWLSQPLTTAVLTENSSLFLLQLHAGREEHRLQRVIASHEPLARIHSGQLHDPLPAPVPPGCTLPAVRDEVCALPDTQETPSHTGEYFTGAADEYQDDGG